MEKAISDFEVLFDFYKEGDVSEEDILQEYKKALDTVEGLEFKRMLSGEEDQLSAILEINPGAGCIPTSSSKTSAPAWSAPTCKMCWTATWMNTSKLS